MIDKLKPENILAVYLLDPIADNIAHPYWQCSGYCGRCYVTAPSEISARSFAAEAFAVSIKSTGQKPTVNVSPWFRSDFVLSRLIDTPLNKQGVGDILLPNGEVIHAGDLRKQKC